MPSLKFGQNLTNNRRLKSPLYRNCSLFKIKKVHNMLINKKMEFFCGLSIFFAKIERGPGDFGLLRQKYITYIMPSGEFLKR